MMPSMACFWSSENDCAEAAGASSIVAASSEANSAGRALAAKRLVMGSSFR